MGQRNKQTKKQTKGKMKTILIDDDMVGEVVQEILEIEGFNTIHPKTSQNSIDHASKNKIDLIITDYKKPTMSIQKFITEIKSHCPNTPIIMYTGYSKIDVVHVEGINEFIEKTFENEKLIPTIKKLLEENPS